MSAEMRAEWPVWRAVLEGAATLGETERDLSLPDVIRLNAMLDMRGDYEAARIQYDKRKRGGK